eukprot:659459-Pelagomonas_calceolata.AAC.5
MASSSFKRWSTVWTARTVAFRSPAPFYVIPDCICVSEQTVLESYTIYRSNLPRPPPGRSPPSGPCTQRHSSHLHLKF